MRIVEEALSGCLLLEPTLFSDDRGWFYESFNARRFQAMTGVGEDFVQDNHSLSRRHVLRGLHYQIRQAQGKLVRCTRGALFDVCVDLRRSSATFGRWAGWELSADNRRVAWIPAGFAHGFLVQSEEAECLYKTTDFWSPEHERTIAWNDPDLAIDWPLLGAPVLSRKDADGVAFKQAQVFD